MPYPQYLRTFPATSHPRGGVSFAEIAKAWRGSVAASGGPMGRPGCHLGPVRDRLFADPRLQRAVAHVHRCGPRAVGELLAELLESSNSDPAALDRVLAWNALDPEIVRAVGADKFPPTTIDPVPAFAGKKRDRR